MKARKLLKAEDLSLGGSIDFHTQCVIMTLAGGRRGEEGGGGGIANDVLKMRKGQSSKYFKVHELLFTIKFIFVFLLQPICAYTQVK